MNYISTIQNGVLRFQNFFRKFLSRRRARSYRKQITKQKGSTLVDREMKKHIKKYAKKRFGSTRYWEWLALYTEIRGEFIPGWIPDDYYLVDVLRSSNNHASDGLSALKTMDYKLFPEFAIKPLFLRISGQFYNHEGVKFSKSELLDALKEYNREFVVKEDSSLGGSRVQFVKPADFILEDLPPESDLVFQPVLKQHESLNSLNPNSVNTIRLVTYLNNNGNFEYKFAALRFSSGNSRVDNTSAGGGFARIQEDGYLEEVAYNKLGLPTGNSHPHTGTIFNSVRVPNFNHIKQRCITAHKKYPYARFVGWDVAIDRDANPVLLEWNSKPLIWVVDALYGPFWDSDFSEW